MALKSRHSQSGSLYFAIIHTEKKSSCKANNEIIVAVWVCSVLNFNISIPMQSVAVMGFQYLWPLFTHVCTFPSLWKYNMMIFEWKKKKEKIQIWFWSLTFYHLKWPSVLAERSCEASCFSLLGSLGEIMTCSQCQLPVRFPCKSVLTSLNLNLFNVSCLNAHLIWILTLSSVLITNR